MVIKWLTKKPRKPNSSKRKIVLLRLNKSFENPKKIYSYIEGETKNQSLLREYNKVLIKWKGKTDLLSVNTRVIRGKRYMIGVVGRRTSRSKYGVKTIEKRNIKKTSCILCQKKIRMRIEEEILLIIIIILL